jgi:hypothetical protein
MPFAAALALGMALTVAVPAGAQTTTQQTQPAARQKMPIGPGMGYGRMTRGMGPGMMHGRGRCRGGMMGMDGGMGRGMAMMRHPDGTLAFLKAELKITHKQMRKWNAFARTMRKSATSMRKMWTAHMANRPPQSLPAWLDNHEAMMASRLESLRTMKSALVPLYNALDASQKKTADSLFMRCHGMGRGWGWDPDDGDE